MSSSAAAVGAVVLAAAAAAAVAWSSPAARGADRARLLLPGASVRFRAAASRRLYRATGATSLSGGVPVRLAAAFAGFGTAWLVGGPVGVALGIVAGVSADRILRRMPATADRRRTEAMVTDLPLALNLLAACLESGSPVGPAVEVVGEAVGGPLGHELSTVAVTLRLGGSPELAWSRLADEPTIRPVARAIVRVSDTGSGVATLVSGLADEQRARARLRADAAARRVAVLVVAPLGLCFLPAFLLLGVVPVVVGLASVVLG